MGCLSFVLLATMLSRSERLLVTSNRVQIQEQVAGGTLDLGFENLNKKDLVYQNCAVTVSPSISRRKWILGLPVSVLGGAGVAEEVWGLEDAKECQNGALVAGGVISYRCH
jgi:hypothetical protein